MEELIFLSDLILGFAVIYALKILIVKLKKQLISSYLFILPVLIIFYIVPYFLDTIFKIEYDTFYYIHESIKDNVVKLFYNLYITAVLIFFIRRAKINSIKLENFKFILKNTSISLISIYDKYWYLFWLIVLFPVFYITSFGDLNYYSTYLTRSIVNSGNIPESHLVINKLVLASVLVSVFIITVLFSKKRFQGKIIIHLISILAILILFYFWVHGKRSIVAIFLTTLITLSLVVNSISFKKLIIVSFVFLISFIGFLSLYGKNITNDFQDTYKALRTDFSRDYGVKFVMYNDLMLERNILPNKFDSFVFTLTSYIPRTIWPEKPYPYAVYFTNSAFGNFGDNELYGWGLTTSIFTESISNLGYFGLFFGPFIIFVILRKEATSTNPIFKLLSIIIAILLLLVQAVSFMVLIFIYLIMLYKEKNRRKLVYNF